MTAAPGTIRRLDDEAPDGSKAVPVERHRGENAAFVGMRAWGQLNNLTPKPGSLHVAYFSAASTSRR